MKGYNYTGGKNAGGAYQHIINQIPPSDVIIEMFGGSGPIVRNIRPADNVTYYIEKNTDVVNRFNFPKHVRVINRDAIEFVSTLRIIKNTDLSITIYADPPYPISTRRQGGKQLYLYEFTDEDHIKLLVFLKSISDRCNIIISSYRNKLYDHQLLGWRTFEFDLQGRAGINREILYMNFPAPKELHDYSYIGNDFTDRQRIKRKISRAVNKFKALPQLERMALIEAVKETFLNQ